MTITEIKAEMKAQGLPFNTQIFKLKVIDGNDGSSSSDYFLSKEERDSECAGIEHPYYYERSIVTFKESAFA